MHPEQTLPLISYIAKSQEHLSMTLIKKDKFSSVSSAQCPTFNEHWLEEYEVR